MNKTASSSPHLAVLILFSTLTGLHAQNTTLEGVTNIAGPLHVQNQSGEAGQVLMNTGPDSAPVWFSSALTGGGRFWATNANNTTALGRMGFEVLGTVSSQDDSLDLLTATVTGTDFSVSTSGTAKNRITINRSGLYHFEGLLRYFVTSETNVNMFPRAILLFKQSGSSTELRLAEIVMELTGSPAIGNGFNSWNKAVKFELNIHLNAGTTCTFITGFTGLRYPNNIELLGLGISAGGYIAGHFIAE